MKFTSLIALCYCGILWKFRSFLLSTFLAQLLMTARVAVGGDAREAFAGLGSRVRVHECIAYKPLKLDKPMAQIASTPTSLAAHSH